MEKWEALRPSLHAGQHWVRFTHYHFAATKNFVPVTLSETTSLLLQCPFAFVLDKGKLGLVAILSLVPDQNLFVGADGKWTGTYIPAFFRSYPFALIPNAKSEPTLCFDANSGFIQSQAALDAIPIFSSPGKLCTEVQEIFGFLSLCHKDQTLTAELGQALHQTGLLKPWELAVDFGPDKGGVKKITGMLRGDAQALEEVPDHVLSHLVKSGALGLFYAQIHSIKQVQELKDRHEKQALQEHEKSVPGTSPTWNKEEEEDLFKF